MKMCSFLITPGSPDNTSGFHYRIRPTGTYRFRRRYYKIYSGHISRHVSIHGCGRVGTARSILS